MKPVEIEFLIKNGTKATLEQITTDLNQVGREGSQSVGATSSAFEDAQRQALILCNVMGQLEGKIKELRSTPPDIDQTENIAQIEVLQKKIEELKLHIKQLEEVAEDTQVMPTSLPLAKRQFDGLHFSIQQMAREMPTLAMGPQMFFLAISNNLPIFSDELARAKREYAELIKTGQKGTPVWKQVVKSIFSWQTAMTTGIMLLVMYGDEIIKFISGTNRATDSLQKAKESLENVSSSITDIIDDIDKFNKKADDVRKLSERYKELSSKTSLAKSETEELNNIINILSLAYPEATSRIDEYGNAVAISTSKVERAIEAERKLLLIKNRDKIEEAADSAGDLFKSYQKHSGLEQYYKNSMRGDRNAVKEYNTLDDRGQTAYAKLAEGAIGRVNYNTDRMNESRANAEESLDLLYAYIMEMERLSMTSEEIAKNINTQTGTNLSAGNINWIKKQIEDEKDIVEDIEEASSPNYDVVYNKAKKTWEDAKAGLLAIESDRARFTKNQYEKAVNAEQEARIAFEKEGGDTSGTSSNVSSQAQQAYQTDRLASLKDAREAELDLERSTIKDKIKLIEFERDARINAIKEEKEAYKQKHGENADTSGFDRQITVVEKQAGTDIQEQVQEDAKAGLIAMQEYLKEYGTFQQKKYAVAQEYARRIEEAQTEGERLSLEKELASYNSTLQAQDLKMNIDWGTVFGEFGGMFSEMIKPALEDAKKYIETDEFKNSDEASKQALIEAIAQMEQSLGGSGSLNFKQLGVDIQSYQNSLIALNTAKQEEIEAIEKLKEAQKVYETALKNGTEAEIAAAKTNLEGAENNATAASENVQAQIGIANQAQQSITSTATTLKASMDNVTQGLSKIASGSLTGAYEGLIQASKGVGGVMEKFADKLESVPIIGLIVSLIDIFKDGLSLVIGGLLDSVFDAVSGIISDVLSGDLLVTIGESISKGVVNIIKSIFTLGGLLGFMDDESEPDLQGDIDRLTASNERLEEALNRLADKMDDAPTSEATNVYKEQLDNLTGREQNTQAMMQREGSAWARSGSGFAGLGGKSSSNKFIDDNISSAEWGKVSKAVGREINSAADFWGLSPEEMAKVADEAGGIYDKIKGYADDGHKDAAKYMDDYIAYAKEREEIEKAYYEKLTNTSFDSVRDEFKSTLLDMESDAEDFATNFEKMLQNAIIESMMTEKYDQKLKKWYQSFGDAMEDGKMSPAEKDALKKDYDSIVKEGLKERDGLKDIFGWDSDSESNNPTSQSGRSGSFETMSQDQGTKLEGLFTANEMRTAQIEETVERVDVQMSIAVGHLEKIEENTGDCAEYLESIKDDIKRMINDGLKVK